MSRADKLLVQMRRSRSGWKPDHFRTLYRGFGFEVIDQGKHTKYRRPRYSDLWTMIPRSDPLSKSYAEDAIEIIDELTRREANQ